ncbi:MAG: class I SAM-dependent RNA methyltransferase [Planctomycetes bacterium]|nr:class I SAM-dependent RNA methyltransferase [Planctomycetota bacterium]
MTQPLPLFAACQPGLEPFLLAELQALDIDAQIVPGGATFEGDIGAVQRACLWLGTASHVRIRLAQFRCRALGELQRKAAEFTWRDWLVPRVPLVLTAKSRRSRVYHTGAIAERIHDAVGAAFGQPPLLAKDGDEVTAPIHIRFSDDVCTISLDATSTPLHRRGYRLDGRKAPLREDIAHALVLASGFEPGDALLDPFCGSGTIAIEAAAIARCLPPGRLRPPALQHSARFDPDAWQQLLADVEPSDEMPPIACSDRDDGAVEATRANAERAGVGAFVSCEAHALAAQPWLQPNGAPERGVVVTNPPFGMRVKGRDPLLPLYQTLGHRIQRMGDGWRAAILAHDVRLARRAGLSLRPAFTTKHGGLSVTAMTSAERDADGDGDDAS